MGWTCHHAITDWQTFKAINMAMGLAAENVTQKDQISHSKL
jgi:hypothetical protein